MWKARTAVCFSTVRLGALELNKHKVFEVKSLTSRFNFSVFTSPKNTTDKDIFISSHWSAVLWWLLLEDHTEEAKEKNK